MLENTTEFTVTITSERGELSLISLNRIEQELRRAVNQSIKWEMEHRDNLEQRKRTGHVDEALISAKVAGVRVQTGLLT